MPAQAQGVTAQAFAVQKSTPPAALAATARAAIVRRHGLKAHAAWSGCWDWKVWENEYNAFGTTVARYQDPDVYWCGNGSTITYRAAVHPVGYTYYLGWSYDGEISYSNYGGVGSQYWTHNTQGHFCYIDTAVAGCVQNWYPNLQTQAWGNGGLWFNGKWLAYG